MTRGFLRALPLLLAAMLGCEQAPSTGSGTAPPPPSGAVKPTIPATSMRTASSAPPRRDAPPETFGGGRVEVKATLPGEEPRKMLAYASAAINRQAKLAVELTPPTGAPMRFYFDVTWSRADAGPLAFAVKDALLEGPGGPKAGAQKAMFMRMRQMFRRVAGKGTVIADRHVSLTQDQGQATTPPLPWLLHLLAIPLPDSEVGVGAKWSARHAIDASGRKGSGERKYELVAMEGDRLTVALSGGDGWMAAGGKAQGTTDLRGEVTLTLGDPLPVTCNVTVIEEVVAGAPKKDKGPRTPQGKTTLKLRME